MPSTQTYKIQPTFSCHELESAAFLWARGLRFLGIEPSPTLKNPKHVIFQFHNPDGLCQEEIFAFERGAQIAAVHYANALKQLKDQLFRRVMR